MDESTDESLEDASRGFSEAEQTMVRWQNESGFVAWFKEFDEGYLKPLLGGKPRDRGGGVNRGDRASSLQKNFLTPKAQRTGDGGAAEEGNPLVVEEDAGGGGVRQQLTLVPRDSTDVLDERMG